MVQTVWEGISEERVVELTRELVRRPTVNPPGDYESVTSYLEDEFRKIGLEVTLVEGEPGRRNVVGLLKGSGKGEAFCLAAHTDVVSVGDLQHWEVDPFEGVIRDGILWGRGSADSKGMLAGMIAAVEAIAQSKATLGGDLYVVAYVDDETAGPMGLRHVFDKGAVKARQLVLGEATDFVAQYVFKGRVWFTVETLGQSAHGAFPERGINAIEKAFEVIQAVKSIDLGEHPELGRHSKNFGTIRGGQQVNVVPDSCTPSFDLRWGPPMKSQEVLDKVNEVLERLREDGINCNPPVVTEERDPLEFSTRNPLLGHLGDAVQEVRKHEMKLGGWYSSGELYPVFKNGHIDYGAVIGPGQPWQAHAFNEQIKVKDLVSAARIYSSLALRVCQAK